MHMKLILLSLNQGGIVINGRACHYLEICHIRNCICREVALFREIMYRYGSSWGWLLHVCNTFCYKLEFGLFRLALLQLFTQLCNFSNIVNSNIHNLIKRRRVISPSRKK